MEFDFSVQGVAKRLEQVFEGKGSRQVAKILQERTGYEASYESVRRARKGLQKTIPHDLIGATAVAFGIDAGWILAGGSETPVPAVKPGRADDVSLEPVQDRERLHILRLLRVVESAVRGRSTAPASERDQRLDLETIRRLDELEAQAERVVEEHQRQKDQSHPPDSSTA